jgi:plasmid stabilization system protein ParE
MTRELHPQAEQEFNDAAHWYAEQSLFAAGRFVTAIEAAIEIVTCDPERFQRVGEGVQVYRLDRFPYKLYCEFDSARQHVRFLCIMHNKRRLDYWRGRISGSVDT